MSRACGGRGTGVSGEKTRRVSCCWTWTNGANEFFVQVGLGVRAVFGQGEAALHLHLFVGELSIFCRYREAADAAR